MSGALRVHLSSPSPSLHFPACLFPAPRSPPRVTPGPCAHGTRPSRIRSGADARPPRGGRSSRAVSPSTVETGRGGTLVRRPRPRTRHHPDPLPVAPEERSEKARAIGGSLPRCGPGVPKRSSTRIGRNAAETRRDLVKSLDISTREMFLVL